MDACAWLAYLTLAIAYTWPLALHVGAVVPKDLGDPLFSTWAIWWNARVLPFTEAWWQAPIFHPAADAMALADHRVGLTPLTTPLVWAGASPLAAYGAAFLASFVLSAGAAYALCLGLTGSRMAAFAGGLAFGFHPFRAAHLEHLELLSSYWLALTLLLLHRWRDTRSRAALAGVTFTLVLQALTAGYYYFYALALLAGWVAWFAWRRSSWRELGELGIALAASLAALAPVLWRYRRAHDALGLSRSIVEIEELSADLAGFLTTPEMLAVWNLPRPGVHAETAVFPGVVALAAVAAALWGVWRDPVAQTRAWAGVRWTAGTLTAAAAGAALVAAIAGPFVLHLGVARLSVGEIYKPLSVAFVGGLAWLAASARLRAAWQRESAFAFYVLATLAMWTLALGPTARAFGERVLYKAPYAWLMTLPGFSNAFRAPARFAMLAALTLAVAAALAAARLAPRLTPAARRAGWGLLAAGILADGWIAPLPLHPPPPARPGLQAAAADAALLELPAEAFDNLAAMYRATSHGRVLVNGYSGYEPPHFTVLRLALADGHPSGVTLLAHTRAIAVATPATAEGRRIAAALRREVPEVTAATAGGDEVLTVPRRSGSSDPAEQRGASLPVAAIGSTTAAEDVGRMHDGDLATAWTTGAAQHGGEQVVVRLPAAATVVAVELRLGGYAYGLPVELGVDVSDDGVSWRPAWRGDAARAALAGALADPRVVPMMLTLSAGTRARHVRITQTGAAARPWAVAEIAVLGVP